MLWKCRKGEQTLSVSHMHTHYTPQAHTNGIVKSKHLHIMILIFQMTYADKAPVSMHFAFDVFSLDLEVFAPDLAVPSPSLDAQSAQAMKRAKTVSQALRYKHQLLTVKQMTTAKHRKLSPIPLTSRKLANSTVLLVTKRVLKKAVVFRRDSLEQFITRIKMAVSFFPTSRCKQLIIIGITVKVYVLLLLGAWHCKKDIQRNPVTYCSVCTAFCTRLRQTLLSRSVSIPVWVWNFKSW